MMSLAAIETFFMTSRIDTSANDVYDRYPEKICASQPRNNRTIPNGVAISNLSVNSLARSVIGNSFFALSFATVAIFVYRLFFFGGEVGVVLMILLNNLVYTHIHKINRIATT